MKSLVNFLLYFFVSVLYYKLKTKGGTVEYLDLDKKKWTDYHNAGFFSLEEAAELVLCHAYALISPDASGEWLVVKIKEME